MEEISITLIRSNPIMTEFIYLNTEVTLYVFIIPWLLTWFYLMASNWTKQYGILCHFFVDLSDLKTTRAEVVALMKSRVFPRKKD